MALILNGTDGLSDVDGTAATPAIRGTDANTGIFFPAADTIAFSEGGVESMRIDSAGNVGIGTASPVGTFNGTFLQINGAINNTAELRFTSPLTGVSSSDGSSVGIGGDNNLYIYNRENTDIIFGTNNIERIRIPFNAGGITFPATQSASSDANTLDDYEEGTFTPVIGGSVTNPTLTYDSQAGFYTKIGNVVNIHIYLQTSARTGGSGSLQITGLPFAQSNTANRFGGNALFYAVNSGLATASLFPNGASGNTIFTILASKNDGSNWGDVPVANIPNSVAAIKIQITYLVNY